MTAARRGGRRPRQRGGAPATRSRRVAAPAAKSVSRLQLAIRDEVRPRTDRALLARAVAATLAYAEQPGKPVSLLLTDDAGIARLHAEYLGDPTPTDVMSFDVDGEAEIVVSVQTAVRVAKQRGHTARAELALYVVHGLLHTLGFDDITARDRVRMRAAEAIVLRRLRLVVHAVDA